MTLASRPTSRLIVRSLIRRLGENVTPWSVEDVRKYCHENLTGYKCPRDIEFRTELPKSNVGKILRRELRDEAKRAKAA